MSMMMMGAGKGTAVVPPSAPVAEFVADDTTPTDAQSVQFTDQSTNTPTSWLWEKNNGGGWAAFTANSTTQNPTQTFAAGTWSIRLTATNAGGSDGETKTNYIVSTTPVVPPVADFSGTPTSGSTSVSATFTDLSTNTPTSWLWEKNDGGGWVTFTSQSGEQNPTETFDGSIEQVLYSVRLTATNAGGSDAETKTDYITVDP